MNLLSQPSHTIRFTLIVICLHTVACRDQGVNVLSKKSIDYSTIQSIQYSRDIQPILTTNCLTAGCHNSHDGAYGLVLDSWQQLLRGSRKGAVIISGNSTMSHLMQVINADTTLGPVSFPQMPLGRYPLSKDDISLLKRWIEEGAKDDAGIFPFEVPTRGKVFVTNQTADLVGVIDIASNLAMRFVRVGNRPAGSIPAAPDRKSVV